ncbi:endonuclease III domain-containing protein [Candidatus Woesearchaeota archaeon]|jgi:endonuclease III related protein|nr:endonuclease III domain-containing protein [Candidatus Woesearchaeota archaeon]MBT6518492.1 endonuclease III domain-containing protein [Candidatus Woesearchaeota archaeon]MBT7367004.1 endonuclease III domain-containing protein [Candidatus Woesearchaeota archaeon]
MRKIKKIYQLLLTAYGYQGWWPILNCKGNNPTKTGSVKGYHPKDYSYPQTDLERFEICIGAILTQNTGWVQVEKALQNLEKLKLIDPNKIINVTDETLKTAIKPAGYFNQKARKLKLFSQFFIELNDRVPTREGLLDVWGVGPETADSILLYGYHVPVFVIDAYTKRIFSRIGLINADLSYDEFQKIFHNVFENIYEEENKNKSELFNEYHALIVEHAKRNCKVKPDCECCVLKRECEFLKKSCNF